MRKIREVLRLTAASLSARQIASSVGIARSTVSDLQRRAIAAGVNSWAYPPAGLSPVITFEQLRSNPKRLNTPFRHRIRCTREQLRISVP